MKSNLTVAKDIIPKGVTGQMKEVCQKNMADIISHMRGVYSHQLYLAKALYENYSKGIYKFMGFNSFMDFSDKLGMPLSTVRRLKDTYKHWCINKEYAVKDLETIAFTKLYSSTKFLDLPKTSIEKKKLLKVIDRIPGKNLHWIKAKDVTTIDDIETISNSIVKVEETGNKKQREIKAPEYYGFDVMKYLENPIMPKNLADRTGLKLVDVKTMLGALIHRIKTLIEFDRKQAEKKGNKI